MNTQYVQADENGIIRCRWGDSPRDYRTYHDTEWGMPINDDNKLFEKVCLEGFQSGLSWHIILKKRENFRKAFAHFDFTTVATFGPEKVEELMMDQGIVRNRKKIEATINNAQRAGELVQEFGSLAGYFWQWEPTQHETHSGKGDYHHPIPSITDTSKALSKDLKKRGWQFFGPTTCYAFMQAVGMVNDHLPQCHCFDLTQKARASFKRPQIKTVIAVP